MCTLVSVYIPEGVYKCALTFVSVCDCARGCVYACVNVHVCIHVCIHTSACISYIYMQVICACMCTHECIVYTICLHMCVHVLVCTCIQAYVNTCVYMHVCIHMSVCIYTGAGMCIYKCICMCIHVSCGIYMCVCVCVHVLCSCVFMYTCVWNVRVCTCVCTCVCMCICVLPTAHACHLGAGCPLAVLGHVLRSCRALRGAVRSYSRKATAAVLVPWRGEHCVVLAPWTSPLLPSPPPRW